MKPSDLDKTLGFTDIVEYLKYAGIPSSWGQCLCASLADVCLCNLWKGAKMVPRVNYLHL